MSKKGQKALASATVMSLVLTTALTTMPAMAATTVGTPVSGTDRVATSIAIAEKAYANKDWTTSTNAVIASGADDSMVDALAVAPFAYQKKAAILLTDKHNILTDAVITELTARKITNVYLVGAACSDANIAKLAAAKVTVTKYQGKDREATADLINAELEKLGAPKAYAVVDDHAMADALSIAAIAASQNYEIVLSKGNTVAKDLAGKTVYAVGGSGVLSDALVTKLGATRLSQGTTRYGTNAAVLAKTNANFDTVYVTDGTNEHLVDALAGSVLAAQTASPIVLVNTAAGVDSDVTAALTAQAGKVNTVTAIGGAVTTAITDAIKTAATPVVTDLKVDSVSAINAKQIKVTFTKEVNETAAETIGNYYTVNAAGVATAEVGTASLQSDNKTVIITLGTAIPNGAAYGFKVSGVTDTVGNVVPDYTTTFIGDDEVAPTLVSASATAKLTTNSITLTFSEPVDKSVASVTVDGTFATINSVAGSNDTQYTVTTGTSLNAGSTHNLSVMNFKDYAGNFIPTNPLATSVTVSADTVAPNVVSAVVKGDSVLEVTFDKAMNIATLTTGYNASNAADLSAQNVKLLDGNLGTTAGHLSAPTAVDSTNKVFDFSIAGTTWNGTTNVESAIVALNNTIADLSGNTITAVTKNVSFNKDVAAPGLVSAVYKNVATYGTTVSGTPITTTYGCIVFTYNTDITAGVAPSTVINDQGTQVSGILGTPVVNNSDATQLVVPLTAAVASGTTSYMILLPTGMVTDDAQTPNSSVAVNQVVSVSAGAVVVGDTTAPSVASAGSNGTAAITTPAASATAAQSLTQNAVIDVNYTEAGSGLDLTTVVNTNNYRLDGLPLPAGSYVTVTGANTTTITLPLGSLTTDKTTAGSGYILTISGIKDKSGNAMATSVENVTLKADANPVLNSAVVNSDGSLSAGFSLGLVDATTVTTGSDFVLTVNGSPLTFAASVAAVAGTAGAPTQYTITNGTGSESGKYVLTVYDAAGHVYNLNNASTITFATAASQAGGAGHAISAASLGATLKASTSITVK